MLNLFGNTILFITSTYCGIPFKLFNKNKMTPVDLNCIVRSFIGPLYQNSIMKFLLARVIKLGGILLISIELSIIKYRRFNIELQLSWNLCRITRIH